MGNLDDIPPWRCWSCGGELSWPPPGATCPHCGINRYKPEHFEAELERLGLAPAALEPVDAVLATLPVPAGARLAFYLSHRGSLAGATPLEALAAGRLEKVLDTAWAYVDGPRK